MCVGPSRKVAIETFKIINGSSRRQGRGTRSSFWPPEQKPGVARNS